MGIIEDNADAYQNLTESNDTKGSSKQAKWTAFLFLCCMAACSASFQFGFNIGSTNLPTQVIKDFYGAVYHPDAYSGYEFLERGVVYARFKNISEAQSSWFNDSAFFEQFIENTHDVKQINLEMSHLEKYLINKSQEEFDKDLDEFKSKSEVIEGQTTFLWTITNCMFVVGGMLGALTSKYILDFFGRRNGILFISTFTIVSSGLLFIGRMMNMPSCIIVSRLFAGLHGGMSCGLVPTYLNEISPAALRGATGVMHQLLITVGILIAQILGFRELLGTRVNWHILLALPLIPAIIGFFSLLLFCPESPKALLVNKRDEHEAKKALQKLRNSQNVTNEINQMNLEANDSTSGESVSIFQLFKMSELRWPLITGLVIQLSQQFCGINAIFFYSEGIFKAATIPDEFIQYAVLATGIVNVIMTVVCVPLIDKLGRKPLLVYPMIIIIIDFILLTVFLNLKNVIYSYLSIVCIIVFIMAFAVGLGPIPFIYVAEVFKSEARGSAFAICMFTNWAANLLLTLSFPYLAQLLTNYVFIVFTVFVLFATIVIFVKVPETKGRSIDEIMTFFEGKEARRNRTSNIQLMNRVNA